jgi:hypothetical protein
MERDGIPASRPRSISGNHNERAAHFWRSVSSTSIQLNRQLPRPCSRGSHHALRAGRRDSRTHLGAWRVRPRGSGARSLRLALRRPVCGRLSFGAEAPPACAIARSIQLPTSATASTSLARCSSNEPAATTCASGLRIVGRPHQSSPARQSLGRRSDVTDATAFQLSRCSASPPIQRMGVRVCRECVHARPPRTSIHPLPVFKIWCWS